MGWVFLLCFPRRFRCRIAVTEIGLFKSAHVRSAVGCAKWPRNISYQRDCPPLSTYQSRQPISLDTGHGYDDCTGRNSDLVMCLFSCDGRNSHTNCAIPDISSFAPESSQRL